jgi:hypothetical protein
MEVSMYYDESGAYVSDGSPVTSLDGAPPGGWAAALSASGGVDVSGASPTTSVPWYSGLSSIIGSVGKAATGILQTQQGAVYDQYGRLVSIQGKAVTNYSPSSTLAGLAGGLSITSLLIIGFVIYLVVKAVK